MTSLLGGMVSDKTRQINKAIDDFLLALRRGKVFGSYDISTKTAYILLMVIDSKEWNNAAHLIELIKEYGKRLTEAKPLELSIVNTVRRVLFIIRDEHKLELAGLTSDPATVSSSESNKDPADRIALLSSSSSANLKKSDGSTMALSRSSYGSLNESGIIKAFVPSNDLSHSSTTLRKSIVSTIQEFLEELKEVGTSIATQALDHLHAKEIVLTYGKSRTVEQFLKFAALKRTFEVVVVESAPGGPGQEMAMSLASAGLETCLITDSAVFAIMSRVNKVIIGTHAVMANGGLLASAGTHMVAQAAKHFNVPVVVCTGLYKLSPLYAHDQDSFNELKAPAEVLDFSDAQRYDVSVKHPAWDYTPPELVSLYITNTGSYSPTYIYRLLAEYYHPEDMDL